MTDILGAASDSGGIQAGSVSFSFGVKLNICGTNFEGRIKSGDKIIIEARAENVNLENFFDKLSKTFNISDPGFSLLSEIPTVSLGASYNDDTLAISCEPEKILKKFFFSYKKKDGSFIFAVEPKDISLSGLPFISSFLGGASADISSRIVFSDCETEYEGEKIGAGLTVMIGAFGVMLSQLIYEYKKNKFLAEENGGVFWKDVNKSVSAATIRRIGISFSDGKLGLALDVSVSAVPLTVSAYGAGISVDVRRFDVGFLFSGFGLEYKSDFLTIGGAFRKTGDEYAGTVIIGIKTFSVTLFGRYSKGHILVYALINADIGGPPAFFVTGIAAAFGYNMKIAPPGIDNVGDFPMIKAAMGGGPNADEMMKELSSNGDIADSDGDKFISAGVRFTSFGLANSFALLTVGFGKSVTVSLLGISEISVPPGLTDKSGAIAYARLALKAALDPSEGVFSVQAQLTPESYILSKSCVLTGGFAFFLWFGSNPHKGDMVITLGGYSPDYKKPEHYPDVPRLGFHWDITKHLSVSGEAYFALTPSCVMAGARMSAVYSDGGLKAWFAAGIDLMMCWKPVYYEAKASASLGASYTMKLLGIHHTFSIELSARADFWGPKFSGKIHVKWFIISFTIKFGKAPKNPPYLTYKELEESFLPKSGNENDSDAAPLSIAVEGEALGERDGVKFLRADGLCFIVSSAVPLSENGEICSVPMGKKPFDSGIDFSDSTERENGGILTREDYSRPLPKALWERTENSGENDDKELIDVKTGYLVKFPEADMPLFPKNFGISLEDLYMKGAKRFENCFEFFPREQKEFSAENSIDVFARTVNSPDVRKKRAELLKKAGITAEEISLAKFADKAEELFDENIILSNH